MTDCAGLTGKSAAINIHKNIITSLETRENERLTDRHLQGFKSEIIINVTTVDNDLSITRNEANTGNGLFTAANRLILNLCHFMCFSFRYHLTSSSTSGFWASCSCSAPAYTRSFFAI